MPENRKSKNIRLGERDSALVFYDAGDIRVFIPNQKPDEESPDSAVICSAIAVLFSNEPRSKALLKQVETLFETLYSERFENKSESTDDNHPFE